MAKKKDFWKLKSHVNITWTFYAPYKDPSSFFEINLNLTQLE
jgi:hypothetical protein